MAGRPRDTDVESEAVRKRRLKRIMEGMPTSQTWRPGDKVRFKHDRYERVWDIVAVSENGLYCRPVDSPGARHVYARFSEVKISAV